MQPKPEIKTVALYARVSTKDGRQDTENQLITLREYCGKMGWKIIEEYVDHETGRTAQRSQFQWMFTDARARKFDMVLFWALDRFSREGARETLNHLEKLTSYGVFWRSHTEEYLDSCGMFRDAVLSILAVIAKQESVRRSERAKAGVAKARRSGNTLGRRKIILNREKVRQLAAQGKSKRELAAMFHVSVMTIHRIIKEAIAA